MAIIVQMGASTGILGIKIATEDNIAATMVVIIILVNDRGVFPLSGIDICRKVNKL